MIEENGCRILLVEDDEGHRELITRAFHAMHPKCRLDPVNSLSQVETSLAEQSYDLIIADMNLPDGSGIDILPVSKNGRYDIPLVLVTSYGTENIAVQAMKAGALDYVVKSGDWLEELPLIASRAVNEWKNRRGREIAEQGLRESESRLRLALNAARMAIFDWDTIANRVRWDGQYEEILGLDGEKLNASCVDFSQLIHPDDLDKVIEKFSELDRDNTNFRIEFRVTPRSELIHWISFFGTCYFDWNGVRTRILGVLQDITERKQFQDELQEREKELERALRISSLGEIVAEMAHELNQPLCAITNYTAAAEKFMYNASFNGSVCEDALSCLPSIAEQAQRAAEIIRRLRSFTQKEDVEKQELFLDLVVLEAISLAEISASPLGIRVHTEISPEQKTIVADPIQIEQVLHNLLRNAFDVMEQEPHEDRIVTVSTQIRDLSAVLSIKDRGPGISQEQEKKIFDPFFTTKKTGVGLGLAICKRIIEAHQGKLWFTKNSDKGITFHFSLPLKS